MLQCYKQKNNQHSLSTVFLVIFPSDMPAKPDIIATEEEKKPDNEDGVLLYLAIKVKEEFKDDENNDKMRQDVFDLMEKRIFKLHIKFFEPLP